MKTLNARHQECDHILERHHIADDKRGMCLLDDDPEVSAIAAIGEWFLVLKREEGRFKNDRQSRLVVRKGHDIFLEFTRAEGQLACHLCNTANTIHEITPLGLG